MKVFRGVGKGIKAMVNFPRWMGARQLTQTGKDIGTVAKVVFTTQSNKKNHESFDEAVRRLRLSEADIAARQNTFLKTAKIYSLFGLTLFLYTVYLIIGVHLAAAFLSLVLTVLAFTFALRQHFWYFQMKQRKLGCTIKEWFRANFQRGK